ncbi:MAG TPA: hypothetical protein VHY30_08100 [Verrucomicrobiae bacterium]|nr:hypothetical protein [Verrucomicrobiae bacterium]
MKTYSFLPQIAEGGKAENAFRVPTSPFDDSSSDKMTNGSRKKFTIVPKGNKAFLEIDKVTPYVQCCRT